MILWKPFLKKFTRGRKASKNRKGRNLVFEPLNIKFDSNFNPVINTLLKAEDYNLAKSILTDIRVMRTSTAFACGIPVNDHDLHVLYEFNYRARR